MNRLEEIAMRARAGSGQNQFPFVDGVHKYPVRHDVAFTKTNVILSPKHTIDCWLIEAANRALVRSSVCLWETITTSPRNKSNSNETNHNCKCKHFYHLLFYVSLLTQ